MSASVHGLCLPYYLPTSVLFFFSAKDYSLLDRSQAMGMILFFITMIFIHVQDNGFLVSKETVVLHWWKSETKIWFYQMS